MAKTPEGLVKDKIKHLLEQYECYYYFPATHGYGRSGGFDIICWLHGHPFGIEVKATNKQKPTALQTKNARDAYIKGASVLLIHKDNIHELEQLLETIINEPPKFNRRKVWETASNQPTP
jgi:hypothetical protein